MSKQLIINEVQRVTNEGIIETLKLAAGVNILEGPPDSGKTVWLTIIDYLFGDPDKIEDVLSQEYSEGVGLYSKYITAKMNVSVGDKNFDIERRWHEPGMRGKIFINGSPILVSEFSDFILTELEIPILNFPKGNPYSNNNTWPSLSWRTILRHIYRKEKLWGDIADKQPFGDQHAVLMQFLGLADKLFSKNFSDVVDKRKKLIKLEVEKEQFGAILDKIGQGISNPNENITFITRESINEAIKSLEAKIQELLSKRQEIIDGEVKKVEQENTTTESFILEKTNERAKILEEIEKVSKKQKGLGNRIVEFKGLQNSIKQETDKLVRTKEAGLLLSDLKISHCPACDQEVLNNANRNSNDCFLCHQPMNHAHVTNRMDFEISQLSTEVDELSELMHSLSTDEEQLSKHEEKLKYNLILLDRDLAPIRQKITALISPELGSIDTERGRYEEQIENLKRILKSFDYKDELIKKIDTLNGDIAKLEGQMVTQEEDLNFEEAGGWLEDEMANYLNKINVGNIRWGHGKPNLRIGDKGFSFKVNNGNWSKTIGATSGLYFILAYHYGLLALSKNKSCNYPGLLILDFAPELPNTEKNTTYNESYVVEPFIDLCTSSDVPMQVIITGNAFQDIEGANKISMAGTW